MNTCILRIIWWSICLFILTPCVVFLTIGSLSGQRKIGTAWVGIVVHPSSSGHQGGVEVNMQELTGALLKINNFAQSEFQPLLPLPLSFYNEKLCGRLIGPKFASIRILFEPNIEIIAGNPNVAPCILFNKEGEKLFNTDKPQASLASLTEGREAGYFQCIDSLSPNPTGFPYPVVSKDCIEDYSGKIQLSLELASPLYMMYLVSFLFVLGLINLFEGSWSIMKKMTKKYEIMDVTNPADPSQDQS